MIAPIFIFHLGSAARAFAAVVELIEPAERIEAFDDYYRYVIDFAAQSGAKATPFRAFPPQAWQQHAAAELAAYVKLSHMALRSVQHAETQLFIEMAPRNLDQLPLLLEQGVAPFLDAILVDLSGELTIEGQIGEWTEFIGELRRSVRQYGGNAEIWVQTGGTEGIATTEHDPILYRWVREHLLLLHSGADKVLVEPLNGAAAVPGNPSQRTFPGDAAAILAEQLDRHTYLGRLDLGDDVWALVFARDGQPLVVAWAAGQPLTLELGGASDDVEIVNIYGQAEAAVVRDGRLVLALNSAPIYIRGLNGSFIGRAFLDSAIGRLGDMLLYAPNADVATDRVTEMLTEIQWVATDVWYLHDSSLSSGFGSTSAVGGGSLGWQAPDFLSAIETGRPPVPDPKATLERWEQILSDLFGRIRDGYAAQPDGSLAAHGAGPWGELDTLPMLVELVAALGIPWGGDDAAGYIVGTGMLVADAAAFLHESTGTVDPGAPGRQHGSGGHRFEAAQLLRRAFDWLQRADEAENEAAAAAWAIIARETAALAVERHVTETGHAERVMLIAPAVEWEHRAAGNLSIQVAEVVQDTLGYPVDVPLFGVFIREVWTRPQDEWELDVESPSGWQWQAGSVPAQGRSIFFAHHLGLTPLHLRLVVPPDTPAGRYPVYIRLIDPHEGVDAVTLYVTIR